MAKGGRFGGYRHSSRGVNSKEWTGAQLAVNGLGATTVGGWIVDPPTMIDDYESPTLIRMLVTPIIRIEAVLPEDQVVGVGIYVATGDEDDATLPNVLWDPNDDQNSDWVYRFMAPYPLATPSGTLFAGAGADILLDVRTKRKVPRGAGILAVFQNSRIDAGTPVGASIAMDVRVLLISG